MELNKIEYFSHSFDSMNELMEYANKQVKYGTYLHSFSHVNVGPSAEIYAVFVKNVEQFLAPNKHVAKEYISNYTPDYETVIKFN